jgi:hypothetical protein
MASYDFTVAACPWDYDPNVNYHYHTNYFCSNNGTSIYWALLKFPFSPTTLSALTLNVGCYGSGGSEVFQVKPITEDFTPETVTWNTKPSVGSSLGEITAASLDTKQLVVSDLTGSSGWYGLAFVPKTSNDSIELAINYWGGYKTNIEYTEGAAASTPGQFLIPGKYW